MRAVIIGGGGTKLAKAQVGFCVVAFIGFLFFGDQLGAINDKHVRTGVQVPTKVRSALQPTPGPRSELVSAAR